MKKLLIFIAGAIVGAVIMTAGSAMAGGFKALVNEKVGSVWELYVDNKSVGDVPIIKGSSYGPIRQIAEIAGMDVDFEPGKVYLSTKEESVIEKDAEFLNLQIAHTKRLRDALVNVRNEDKARLQEMPTEEARKSLEEAIAIKEEGIAAYEAEITALEAELAALESAKK
ncbi:hypothetical protein [Paenibacillus sp. NPDC057967]|uniref:hypothetical protein n=1 Tax=Paenibacillus sp. NPDC057967 TaxID=3346293 RepID=UPI0036DEB231